MKDYYNFYLKCNVLLYKMIFKNYGLCPRGHLKSMFVEELRGGGSLKSEQKQTGGGEGPSMCNRLLF